MSAARSKLAAAVPNLRVEMNRAGTTPEAIGVEGAESFLTAKSTEAPEAIARQFLERHAAVYGLTGIQVKQLVKIADYVNPAGNLSWVEFRQEFGGIPVFQGEIRFALTRDRAIARTTGNLAAGLEEKNLSRKAQLTPAQAAVKAAAAIGYTIDPAALTTKSTEGNGRITVLESGPFTREVQAELVYFPLSVGHATLAYAMVLYEKVDAYYILVDATTGALLWRKNLTNHQSQTATYSIYRNDSPAPFSPTTALPGQGFQAPGIARTTVTLVGNEPPNSFNVLGWISDGVNALQGNNVHAGLDLESPDGIDPIGQAFGTPNRVFNFSYNPPPNGNEPPEFTGYRWGAATNLFYWTNVYHDRLYRLGFTEAARNFQGNNFGRNPGGGTTQARDGNDRISAETQDYSGFDNANFTTPPDGTAGRMQMYLYSSPSPQRDGALDNEIVLHELTHGLSNRLHANATGLNTLQSAGMGEGWSDFYARCLLSGPEEDVNGIFAFGAYAVYRLHGFVDNYYSGFRRFPYAVKTAVGSNGKPHNPLTFQDIDLALADLSDGAYPPSPLFPSTTATEVHNIGEVWCMMLLEMRKRFVQRLGFAAGNERALQIVTDAMKLDVANPTFIQARDAIFAADAAGFDGADFADIRHAFATRGAGAGASVTDDFPSPSVVESYAIAIAMQGISFTDGLGNGSGVADPGEPLMITVPLKNLASASATGVTALVGSYVADYGDIAPGETVSRVIPYTVPSSASCFSTVSVPVQIDGGTYGPEFENKIFLEVGAFSRITENFNNVEFQQLPSGWTTTTTGPLVSRWRTDTNVDPGLGRAAFGPVVNTVTDAALISPAIAISSTQATVTFKHSLNTTATHDGGVLEIKIGTGAYTDLVAAGGSFVQGGYNSVIAAGFSSPIAGRSAWSGSFQRAKVTAYLPAAANGQNIQLRWRLGSDSSTDTPSCCWKVDDVVITAGAICYSIDADNDGLPDGYEFLNGLSIYDPADAALDFDRDGSSNLEEYIAGTNLQDASSAFRIVSQTRNAAGQTTITFSSVNGKSYFLQANANIENPADWGVLSLDLYRGTGGNVSILDASSGGLRKRFYRVGVRLP